MYILPEMIDMGLEEGQEWPSEAHKAVAKALGLSNRLVTTKDHLTEIVQAVIKIPQDRIEYVTADECRTEFEVPFI